MPDRASEAALVEGVLGGDEEAFRALYRIHATRLYRHALRMTGGDDVDAEDMVQEVWRRAIDGLEGFEGRSSLATWLSSIVTRCALERHRVHRRIIDMDPPDVPIPADPGSASSRLDLERAFEALPAGFRTVLVLHDIEGFRHVDIAELLGVSEGTSKSQLSRARARMRDLLGEDYERP